MPRPRLIMPTVQINMRIAQDLIAKMNLELFSELEQRVPFAAQQKFLTTLLQQHFEEDVLDLAPWLGTPSGVFRIRGNPEVLSALSTHLSKGN